MKIIILLFIFIFCGCSTTIVYAPKCVHCSGNNNTIEIKGSDLEGNKAKQTSAPEFTNPFIPP